MTAFTSTPHTPGAEVGAGTANRPHGTDAASRRRWMVLLVTAIAAVGVIVMFILDGISAAPGTKAWSYQLDLMFRDVAAIVLVAAAIGVATVLFQTVTSNRILTPSLMGFDAFFLLIQTALVFFAPSLQAAAARSLLGFLGETALMVVLTVVLYYWLIVGLRTTVHTLLLIGIVCGIFARSVAALFQRLLDPASYLQVQDAMFASFRAVSSPVLIAAAVLIGACLIAVVLAGSRVDVMLLGRNPAVSLGLHYRRMTMALLIIVSVLVAASTALIGPVMFFGLLVAHGAYALVRTSLHRYTLPAAVLLGIIALAGGELVLRQIHWESALSVIVELAGGALLLYLLIVRKGQ